MIDSCQTDQEKIISVNQLQQWLELSDKETAAKICSLFSKVRCACFKGTICNSFNLKHLEIETECEEIKGFDVCHERPCSVLFG